MFSPISSPPFHSTPGFSSSLLSSSTTTPRNVSTPNDPNPNPNPNPNINHNNIINIDGKKACWSSVGLSCLSPDSSAVHSLFPNGTIVTHFLPLHKTIAEQPEEEEEEEPSSAFTYRGDTTPVSRDPETSLALTTTNNINNTNNINHHHHHHDIKRKRRAVKSVTTKLPSHMMQAFAVDEPLELLCIDNDTPPHGTLLPLLCIYTCKSAFVLQIQIQMEHDNHNHDHHHHKVHVQGKIVQLHEPFESYLTTSHPCTIVKLRPAPHGHVHHGNGSMYQTLCPRGAMLLLASTKASGSSGSGSGSVEDWDASSVVILFHGYRDDPSSSLGLGFAHQRRRQQQQQLGSNPMALIPSEVTVAATIELEQTELSPLIDFGFLPSSSSPSTFTSSSSTSSSSTSSSMHSLWNSLTLILSTKSGNLYALSPIVFHHTILPAHQIDAAFHHFQKEIIQKDHSIPYAAECKRAKAALQFFKDAFGNAPSSSGRTASGGGGGFVKAHVLDPIHSNSRSATRWPVALQTLHIQTDHTTTTTTTDASPVVRMEMIPSSSFSSMNHIIGGSMTGMVLARGSSTVEYFMIPSGEHILPRFGFESKEDGLVLDDRLKDSVVLVERVEIESVSSSGGGDGSGGEEFALDRHGNVVEIIPDPIDETMVHHVSTRGVVTIMTNAIPWMEQRAATAILSENDAGRGHGRGRGKEDELKTNAWTSIVIPQDFEKDLTGIAISSDVQFGHVLVAILSDGTTEAMNMTAAMYLHEAKNQIEEEITIPSTDANTNTTTTTNMPPDGLQQSNQALRVMESMPPLCEQIKPQIDTISNGLSTMMKIVGGATDPAQITPGSLATFLSTTQSSQQNILLPLREMHALASSRQKYLVTMRDVQLEQVKALKRTAEVLKDRMVATKEKMKLVESNMELLSHRSAGVLETVRDLSPTITEAEREYFKDVQRFAASCDKWENALGDIRGQCKVLAENAAAVSALDASVSLTASASVSPAIRLTPEQKQMCENLLEGQNEMLKGIKVTVKQMENKRDKVVVACGLQEERQPLNAITDN